ncbi:hypothetical protein TRAPUB_13468 [Trametes pubescens]|uniref:Uncharacterized protein n=1 Tax=Trametes pubescens TaxID=154538 RepID=A0A1M2VR07_TRAPU|nr:hypothetical protein TRAPUB_13468 [Trametes pubescens]
MPAQADSSQAGAARKSELEALSPAPAAFWTRRRGRRALLRHRGMERRKT